MLYGIWRRIYRGLLKILAKSKLTFSKCEKNVSFLCSIPNISFAETCLIYVRVHNLGILSDCSVFDVKLGIAVVLKPIYLLNIYVWFPSSLDCSSSLTLMQHFCSLIKVFLIAVRFLAQFSSSLFHFLVLFIFLVFLIIVLFTSKISFYIFHCVFLKPYSKYSPFVGVSIYLFCCILLLAVQRPNSWTKSRQKF